MEKFQEPAVCAALEEYKAKVSRYNLHAAKCFVDYANSKPAQATEEPDDEDNTSPEEMDVIRLEWVMHVLGSEVPEGMSKPQDIVTTWDSFAAEHGLDGARKAGSPEERAAGWDDIVRGLRDGLQEVGDDAAELDIPGDFAILLKHADTLEGHLWQRLKTKQQGLVWFQGFNGYSEAKASVCDPDELGDEDSLYATFQRVVAGFKTGYAPCVKGCRDCFMIYGQLTEEEECKWHYYVNLGSEWLGTFDSLVDFLKWYQDWCVPDAEDIEEVCCAFWQP